MSYGTCASCHKAMLRLHHSLHNLRSRLSTACSSLLFLVLTSLFFLSSTSWADLGSLGCSSVDRLIWEEGPDMRSAKTGNSTCTSLYSRLRSWSTWMRWVQAKSLHLQPLHKSPCSSNTRRYRRWTKPCSLVRERTWRRAATSSHASAFSPSLTDSWRRLSHSGRCQARLLAMSNSCHSSPLRGWLRSRRTWRKRRLLTTWSQRTGCALSASTPAYVACASTQVWPYACPFHYFDLGREGRSRRSWLEPCPGLAWLATVWPSHTVDTASLVVTSSYYLSANCLQTHRITIVVAGRTT